MLSHQQNTHVFAYGCKNMNDIFNDYVCCASHMNPGLHFENGWGELFFFLLGQLYEMLEILHFKAIYQ